MKSKRALTTITIIAITTIIVVVTSFLFIFNSPKITSAVIVENQPIFLNQSISKYKTIEANIDPLAEKIIVKLKRPTTANPLNWDESSTTKVNIVVDLNGTEYRTTGQARGGIHSRNGVESEYYSLSYTLPWGFFGAMGGRTKRLGETELGNYTAKVELELLSGSIETFVELHYDIAPAPDVLFHNSAAFDNTSSATENDGDGVVSLTHTSAGNDRAILAVTTVADAPSSCAITYGGTGMDERWFETVDGEFWFWEGATDTGQATGAQTVTANCPGGDYFSHHLGVVSLTGVDQTTPTGTIAENDGTNNSPTVTASGVASDDLIIDALFTDYNGTITVGADQIQRVSEVGEGFENFRMSTQSGTDGGVMSWSLGGSSEYGFGWFIKAVPFNAVAEAIKSGGVKFETGTLRIIGSGGVKIK